MKKTIFLLLLCCGVSVGKPSIDFKTEVVGNGFGVIWGMAFLDAQTLLLTEREGAVYTLDVRSSKRKKLRGAPKVWARGQGGMLDVAIPENGSGWVYFTYSKPKKGRGATTLARAKLQGDSLIQWQDLLVTVSATKTNAHYGSRIAFDGKGHVFFTIGDRGVRPNGQDRSNHAGSVLRLKVDGSVPKDNPFVGQNNIRPEIWSYGHRNPQGLVFDKQQNRLWLIEHGPRGGDEINLIKKGRNYGWPVISYGKEYWGPVAVGEGTRKAGMEQPVKYYTPSIAPASLLLYSGKAFPQWRGNLFAGALKLLHLNRVALNNNGKPVAEERLLKTMNARIRAVAESPEGWIYVSTDNGKVLRLVPR